MAFNEFKFQNGQTVTLVVNGEGRTGKIVSVTPDEDGLNVHAKIELYTEHFGAVHEERAHDEPGVLPVSN